MPDLFQNLLIWHVLFGLTGIVLFAVLLLKLFKENFNLRWAEIISFLGFLSFTLAWIAGGRYYIEYYGESVKPIIKAGDYPWAHGIVMETKEHIFLFLPFLAFIIFLIFLFAGQLVKSEFRLKKVISFLTFFILTLGVLIAAMGMFISGAAQ